VCLAIALVQITPLNAQAVSPAGHYSKKSGGAGEMRVEKSEGGWHIFVIAGGIPRPRGLTAADCGLIAVGAIEGDTFQGEITKRPFLLTVGTKLPIAMVGHQITPTMTE